MGHGTLSFGGGVVVAVYFFGILLVGMIVKPMLRAWHGRRDEHDQPSPDYFAKLRERDLRELHRQEWRDALSQYRDEGGRHEW